MNNQQETHGYLNLLEGSSETLRETLLFNSQYIDNF
jgi:hypothetical protein